MESEERSDDGINLGQLQAFLESLGPIKLVMEMSSHNKKIPAAHAISNRGNQHLTQMQMIDLNVFALKYIYELPTTHYLVITRVVIVGFLAVNAAKEYYRFLIER